MQPAHAAKPLNVRTPPRCDVARRWRIRVTFVLVAALGCAVIPRAADADDGPDWVVAAHRSLVVGDGSAVFGDVAAEDETAPPCLADFADVTLGSGTAVHGSVWGDAVSVRGTPAVDGHVYYSTSLSPAPSTFPAGTTDDSLILPLALMGFASPGFPTDTPELPITIPAGTEVDLDWGHYESIILEAGTATSPTVLRLIGDNYSIGSLTIGDFAHVEFAQPASVLIESRLTVGDYAGIVASWDDGVLAQDTVVLVLGQNGTTGALGDDPPAVGFGTAGTVNTQIWSPNGTIRMGESAFVRGRVIAKWAEIGASSFLTLPGAGCGFGRLPTEAECDDGDPCTDDDCVAPGQCSHDLSESCGTTSAVAFYSNAYISFGPESTAVELAWSAAEPESAVSHYELRQDGVLIAIVASPEKSWHATGLSPTGTYAFEVTAVDLAGVPSEPLAPQPLAMADTNPPVWPLPVLTIHPHSTSADLDWPPAWDDVGIQRYHVAVDGEPVTGAGIVATSFHLDGLTLGESYSVSVSVEDTAGNIEETALSATIYTMDSDRPTYSGSSQISGVVGSSGLELTWSGAEDDVAVLAYFVVVYEDGFIVDSAWVAEPVSFPYAFPVDAATDYGVLVFACDGYTLDACSAAPLKLSLGGLTSDTDPPTWPNPSTISVTATSLRWLDLAWTEASDPSGIKKYLIYTGANPVPAECVLATGQGCERLLGLRSATTYDLQIEVVDWWDNVSDDGPTLAATTAASAAAWVGSPALTATPLSDTELRLDWTLADSTEGSCAYEVTVTPTDPAGPVSFWRYFSQASPHANVPDLTPGTTYAVEVILHDNYGYPTAEILSATATMPTSPLAVGWTWPSTAWLTTERGDPATDVIVHWAPRTLAARYHYQLSVTRGDAYDAVVYEASFPPNVTGALVPGLTRRSPYRVHLGLVDTSVVDSPTTVELTADVPADWPAREAHLARFAELSTLVKNSWRDRMAGLPTGTPGEIARDEIIARCRAMGLRGGAPSFTTDTRGYFTSIAACDLALETSALGQSPPEDVARAFIEDNAALFGISPDDLSTRVSLDLAHTRAIIGGSTRVRFTERIDGLPVHTASFRVVVDASSRVTRAGGHLTPPSAVPALPSSITESQAGTLAADTVEADPADGVTLEDGIYDPAATGRAGPAVRAWRARVYGQTGRPDVFIDRANGTVLHVNDRTSSMAWHELPARDRHIEAYSQSVAACVDFGACVPPDCPAECPLAYGCPEDVPCKEWDDEKVMPFAYPPPPPVPPVTNPHDNPYDTVITPAMLQYSTLITLGPEPESGSDGGMCAALDPLAPSLTAPFTYCATSTGQCIEGAEACRATSVSNSGAQLAAALDKVGAFYYEWTGRVGWDDEPNAPHHRLRALTDFASDADPTNCELPSERFGENPGPARWYHEGALIVLTSNMLVRNEDGAVVQDDAFEFTLAHEVAHGMEYSEVPNNVSATDLSHPWVHEGMADILGVLRQAYERRDDPLNKDPEWFLGFQCDGAECPCGFESTPPYAVRSPGEVEYVVDPDAVESPTVTAYTPLHLGEVVRTSGNADNRFVITKVGQLIGDPVTPPGTTSWTHHGIDVPTIASVPWGYAELTRLFVGTLTGIADTTLEAFRSELVAQARDLATATICPSATPCGDDTACQDAQSECSAAVGMVRHATEAVGLWSTPSPVGPQVPDFVAARFGTTRYIIWVEADGMLWTQTRECAFDADVGSCAPPKTQQICGEGQHGLPAVATSVPSDPALAKLFLVLPFFAPGLPQTEAYFAWLDPEGLLHVGPPPPVAIPPDPSELGAALAVQGGYLYLFYREWLEPVGADPFWSVRVARLAIDVEPTQANPGGFGAWEILDTPDLPSTTGLAAASSEDDPYDDPLTTPRIAVAFGAPSGDPQGQSSTDAANALTIWSFDPAQPELANLSHWRARTADNSACFTPEILGRPSIALFREQLHIVALSDIGVPPGSSETSSPGIVYARSNAAADVPTCTEANAPIETWTTPWKLEGSPIDRPAQLMTEVASQVGSGSTEPHRLILWSAMAEDDDLATVPETIQPHMQGKASD